MDFYPLPTDPFWPTIAELNYPDPVKKLIDQANKIWAVWVEADTAQVLAVEELSKAKTKFEDSILEAARKGEPIPEKPDFEAAENRIKYLAEIARTKRSVVDLAVTELTQGFRTYRVEIAILAVEKAKRGIATYQASIRAISEQLPIIEAARRNAYDGLAMMSDLSDPELRFVPEFGAGDQAQLPTTHEAQAQGIISNLEAYLINPQKAPDGEPASE